MIRASFMNATKPSGADFNRARRKYRPHMIRFLLIAESPPSSGGFFYFRMTIGKDHLFRETMKALELWPRNRPMRRGVDKRSMRSEERRVGKECRYRVMGDEKKE